MTLDEAKRRYPGAETFTFGDNKELCDWLLQLVREGKKTATCGALRDFGKGREIDGMEAYPMVERCDIALNWDGTPALVIQTVEVETRRFCDVEADFALSEGEDDTLQGWQDGHRAYFERSGGWAADMMVVCERFKVVEDFSAH